MFNFDEADDKVDPYLSLHANLIDNGTNAEEQGDKKCEGAESPPLPSLSTWAYNNPSEARLKEYCFVLEAIEKLAPHRIAALRDQVLPVFDVRLREVYPRRWPVTDLDVSTEFVEALTRWLDGFNGWPWMGEVALQTLSEWASFSSDQWNADELSLRMPRSARVGMTLMSNLGEQKEGIVEADALFAVPIWNPGVCPAEDWLHHVMQEAKKRVAEVKGALSPEVTVAPKKRKLAIHCEWLVLYEFERMSFEDIAELYDVTSGAVDHAVRALREWLACPTRARSGRPRRAADAE